MKSSIAIIIAACGIALSGTASAAGCMKGAAVGGVAGHVAGKHAVLGAAAGCAIGHHHASKKQKEANQAAANAPHGQ
ncbi:hypothetical protein [Robbsia sp. KACC 23696]|uniref:hypothetical protein n=1 Tax=Robbsia sp. KACC 23696 TaxID=3149231 RepID=UPI00325C18C4